MILDYFRKNFKYRIFAILIAAAVWLFVFETQNPVQENVVNVPLETGELDSEYVIADKPNNVNVRVQGRKEAIESINPQDIKAYVNVEDVSIGYNLLPVNVGLPPGIRLVSVDPEEVEVEVDEVTGEIFPVDVEINGSPASGYQLGSPEVKPFQVDVLGPDSILEKVETAYVDVEVSEININFNQALPVKFRDEDGNDIFHEWMFASPDTVEVFVPVFQTTPTRTVPILYEISGKPAAGYIVENVSIYPIVIDIYADSRDLLYMTNYLQVEIPLGGNYDRIDTVEPLIVPEGVTPINREEVRVIVDIVPDEAE